MLRLAFILLLLCCNSALAVDLGNGVDYIPPNRKLGVGTKTPSEQLTVNGSFAIKESSAPSNLTGYGKVYVGSSNKELYFLASDQSAVKITNNGSLATSGGASDINGLSDAVSDLNSIFIGNGSGASHSGTTESTALGVETLANNNSGSYRNVALGFRALKANNSGDRNIAVGADALTANTSGQDNVAVGESSLFSNTSGGKNTAIGYNTLYFNLSGQNNTALGYYSLNNTTGNENTGLGSNTLFGNTSGTFNTAVGSTSMYNNTTGNFNSALGHKSLNGNKGGRNNSAFGVEALYTGTTGSNGVAMGYHALHDNNGDNNIAIGFMSSNGTTEGNNNITIGYKAGDAITSGSTNIIIGYDNDAPSATASNQLDIGDTLYADMSTDQVSIGTTSNYGILTLEGTLALDEVAAPSDTTSGYGRLYINSGNSRLYFRDDGGTNYNLTNGATTYAPGGSNKQLQYNNSGVFDGASQLYYNGLSLGISIANPQAKIHAHNTGGGNSYMRFSNNDSDSGSTDGVQIGISGTEDLELRNYENDDIVFYTNNTERIRIMNDGKVGIGINNPSNFLLEINGGNLGPSKSDTLNLGDSNNRWNALYSKKINFSSNGGLVWGSSYDKAYKTYFSLAQISNSVTKTLVDLNGDTFAFNKTYKVTAHNPGTSTLTGAVAYFVGNGSSSFELVKAHEQGQGTEDIEFYLSGQTPKVRLYAGASTRAVQLLIEESPIFGKDNYAFGPVQALTSPVPGYLTLKGRGSGAAVYKAVANSDTLYSEMIFSSTNGSGSAIEKWGVGALGDNHASGNNRFYIYQYTDRNDASVSRFRMIVSNNGNFHYNFMGGGVNDNYGKYVFNGVVALKEEAAAPSNSTGFGKIYVDSANKELYFRAADQSAVKITNNGSLAASGGASAINDLSDAVADSYSVYLGSGSGSAHSGNTYSTGVGIDALKNNDGDTLYNTAIGYQAMKTNNGGDFNTVSGYQALYSNTTGSNNTASGYQALYSNTTGIDNTAIGSGILYSNTTGSYSTAIGYGVLFWNTTGSHNTASGHSTLAFNTTGSYNTASGYGALYASTTGSNNTASGYSALAYGTTGSNNTALGHHVLFYADNGSSNNTAIGQGAGYGTLSNEFSNGTFLGYRAGYGLTTGDNNILIGYTAGDAITSGSTNIIIGYNNDAASNTASNQLDIGDTIYADMSTDQVSIGTTSNYGILTLEGTLALDEVAAPSDTTSGYGRIYVNSGNSKLYFRDDGGTNYSLTNGSGLGATVAINDLSDAVTDTYSVYLGSGSGSAHSGNTYSTALGIDALKNNDGDASENTAVGYQALMTNNGGDANTALGHQSLYLNTTGASNDALGQYALRSNTSGYSNVALGSSSLHNNITGFTNVAVGLQSLYSNTTGDSNTASGVGALYYNTTGIRNVAYGFRSLYLADNGSSNNTAVGYQAGEGTASNEFSNGTFLGYQTGVSLTTGDNNILIGYKTGDAITTGGTNIIIGYDNDAPSATASNQLDIGDTIYADMSTDQVSIGTTSNYGILTLEGTLALDEVAAPSNITGYGKVYVDSSTKELYFRASDQDGVKITNNGAIASTPETVSINDLSDAKTDFSSVYLGTQAGQVDGGSQYNTSVGVGTLRSNTSGWDNVAVGYHSQKDTTTGGGNTSIGMMTLYTNTSGTGNDALGEKTLYLNTTGSFNTGLGIQSLYSNTNGNYNIAIGYGAMYNKSRGHNNVAIGYYSQLNKQKNSGDTSVGSETLYQFNNGQANTALGYQAGKGTTPGFSSNGLYLGYQAGYFIGNGNNNTVIGYQSGYRIGYSVAKTSGNTFVGHRTGFLNTSGANNIFLGFQAGDNVSTGSNNLIIGYDIDAPSATASNQMSLGNLIFGTGVDGTGTSMSSGNVGINDSSPSYKLDVNGTIRGFGITDSSDIRLKENITDLGNTLSKVLKLRGVSYFWKDKKEHGSDKQIGFVAQELEEQFPELVSTDAEGYKSVQYGKTAAVLVEAIKELKAENDTLKDQLKLIQQYICTKEPDTAICKE